jgi:hypothetical protein
MQAPAPLQVVAGIKVVAPLQAAPGPQAVPAGWGTQVPGMMLQARQDPVQAVLQQTPLAQNPEAHWPGLAQALPFGCPGPTQVPF